MSQVVYQEPYASRYRGDRYNTGAAYRTHKHRGQDYAPGDAPAIAVADGTIAALHPLRDSKILGNVVVVRDADGMYVSYCHLANLPSRLRVGSKVKRGKPIGNARLGSTGSAATGRHLHMTISAVIGGVFYADPKDMRDPLAYILERVAKPVKSAAVKAAESKDKALVKRTARYLNKRSKALKLGRVTTSDSDGIRGENYRWLLQTVGRADGIYGRGYTVDAQDGPRTRWLDAHYATLA